MPRLALATSLALGPSAAGIASADASTQPEGQGLFIVLLILKDLS